MKPPRLPLSAVPSEQRARLRAAKRKAKEMEQTAVCDYFERGVGVRPVAEHRFHPHRRWRFDLAFPKHRVALEIEGGAWVQGRHTRGSGYLEDLEKYSEAAALGWLLVRCTPDTLYEASTADRIRRALWVRGTDTPAPAGAAEPERGE